MHYVLQDVILLSLLNAVAASWIQAVDQAFYLLSFASFSNRFTPPVPLLVVIELFLFFAKAWPLNDLIGAKLAIKAFRIVIMAHTSIVKVDVAIAASPISAAPRHMLRPIITLMIKNSRWTYGIVICDDFLPVLAVDVLNLSIDSGMVSIVRGCIKQWTSRPLPSAG